MVELVEPGGEPGDLLAECGHVGFKLVEAAGGGRLGRRRGERLRWSKGGGAGGLAKKVGEAGLAAPGLTAELDDERCGTARVAWRTRLRGAGGEAIERCLDGGKIVEGEEAIGPGAEFAGSLRATQEEQAEESSLVAAEVEHGAGAVLIFRDAGIVHGVNEFAGLEAVERLADLALVKVDHGVAAGALIGGVDEGVEREGEELGGGDLFFDEAAENTQLIRVEGSSKWVGGYGGHSGR